MKNYLKNLVLLLMLAVVTPVEAYYEPLELEPVYDWTFYSNENGIRIDYKFSICQNSEVKNQVLVLLRFTNTSSDSLSMNWSTEVYRNGNCVNCANSLDLEHQYLLALAPGESIQGQATSKADKRLYIFANFIELSPGMSNQQLTDFKLVNINVENL